MHKRKVLIMAGGTGGHIFPALAVAKKLQAAHCQLHWLGSQNGLETQIVPQQGIALSGLLVSGLRGKGIFARVKALLRLCKATIAAIRLLRKEQPQVVLGMGGYAAAPGGIAAYLLNIPLVIHEQNAVAGFTNRCLSYLAKKTLTAFPESFSKKTHAITVGNPVRDSIRYIAPDKQEPRPLRVLVLGGSLGAKVINECLPKALAQCAKSIEVWHQTGASHYESTEQLYQDQGVQARLEAFIDDMGSAYCWADLVVCRAGALTIAELAASGRAALLVPYPFAVDNHQMRNAEYLVQAGAAKLVEQSQFTVDYLVNIFNEYTQQRGILERMSQRAYQQAQPLAAETVANTCLELCHE